MADIQVMQKPQRWDVPFGRELPDPDDRRDMSDAEVDAIRSIKPFCDMDEEKFSKSLPLRDVIRNDTRIRRYGNGDVIVRLGDYGNSAFLIMEGNVRVIKSILDPRLIGRRPPQKKSWWQSLTQGLTNPKSPEVRDSKLYDEARRVDATGQAGVESDDQFLTNALQVMPDLFEKTDNEVMKSGELFGELAALGRSPRTRTIVSDGDSELLEIRWQGMRDLRKHDPALRDYVDARYREFGLKATLGLSRIRKYLDDSTLQTIAEAAEFETYGEYDWYGSYQKLRKKQIDPLSVEPIIVKESHYPNGLILIRSGFARLSRSHGDGERTFSYLGAGDVFGLAELAHNARHQKQKPFSASLRAIGYVDIVRIPTPTFEAHILPAIAEPDLAALAQATHGMRQPPKDHQRDSQSMPAALTADPGMMEFLVENRFINGTATMLIDMDRCTRCDDCVRACADGHDNNPVFVRHGPMFDHFMVANACMHCMDPVCMVGCPTGAIHRVEETGEVVINDLTCIGCQVCAANCPYDNIRMVEIRDKRNNDAIMVDPIKGLPIVKATKCDLCVDQHGGPACERACPHDALSRVDMCDLKDLAR